MIQTDGHYEKVMRAKQGAYETIDFVTKFALNEDDFEIVEEWVETPIVELINNRIDELKRNLNDTDYVVIKIAEGVSTEEEYSAVLENRKQWRAEINELEAQLALEE